MSIGEMQACLARLYVDEPFRRLLHIEPEKALEEYGLTPDESAALQGIDRKMLEYFAASLRNKRKKRIQRAFPMTFKLDRVKIERYYRRYYQLHTARPHQLPHQDVMEFGAFMEESFAQADDLPPYAADLARYERLYYGAAFASESSEASGASPQGNGATEERAGRMDARPRVRNGVQVASFRYDVAAIERALEEGGNLDDLRCEPDVNYIVFRPATADSDARMMRVNAATKVVFDLCDGRRPVSEIMAQAQAILRADGLEEAIVATVDRLLALQVLILGGGTTPAVSAKRRAFGTGYSESM